MLNINYSVRRIVLIDGRVWLVFNFSQIHRGHAADKIRQAQKQPSSVADHRAGVGNQRGDRQSNRARAEQHAGPDAGPLSFLQLEFHHLLVPVLVLHTLYHHGVPLLEHIQGESGNRAIIHV